jgi:hypothetical protein
VEPYRHLHEALLQVPVLVARLKKIAKGISEQALSEDSIRKLDQAAKRVGEELERARKQRGDE